jgi:hypothetical protein
MSACTDTTSEERAIGHEVFEYVRTDRLEAALARFPSSFQTSAARAQLAAVADLVPSEAPQSERTVSYTQVKGTDGSVTTIDNELTYADRILVRRTVVHQPEGGEARLVGFHITTLSPEAIQRAQFTLKGKSALHYIFLLIAVIVPATIIFALVVLFRDKTQRRKWLWALLIVIGLGKLSINWTTGAITFQAISVHLFGAAFSKLGSVVEPWMISFGLPVGALVYLFLRFRRPSLNPRSPDPY